MIIYILVNLIKQSWTSQTSGTSGETWCYTNAGSSKTTIFGESLIANSSIFQPGKLRTAGAPIVSVWLGSRDNEFSDEQAESFVELGRDVAYAKVDCSSPESPTVVELIDTDTYSALPEHDQNRTFADTQAE